jgi:hypothetical protein
MLKIYLILLFFFLSLSNINCQYDENGICMGLEKVVYDRTVKKCICQCCGAKECVPCTNKDFQLERLAMKYICVDYTCDSFCSPQRVITCRGNYSFSLISGSLYSQCYHFTTKCGNSLNNESSQNYCTQIETSDKQLTTLVKSQYDEYNLCMGQLKVSFNTTTKECICQCCGGRECSPCTYADYMSAKLSMKFICVDNFCDSYCNPDRTITCRGNYLLTQVSENYYSQCYDVATKCGSSSNKEVSLNYCSFIKVTKVNPTTTAIPTTKTTIVGITTSNPTNSNSFPFSLIGSFSMPVQSSKSLKLEISSLNQILFLFSIAVSFLLIK